MSDKFLNSSGLSALRTWILSKLSGKADTTDLPDEATDSVTGTVKLNSSESITLNSDGQLNVGGRLGQMSDSTGIYSPKTISPQSIGSGSFLLTEGSGLSLGNKSLAVVTGSNINLKTQATAGSTTYIVSNTFLNRIFAASAVGATAAVNEATAAEKFVHITSVTLDGSRIVPTSTSSATGDIIITTDESLNPDSTISALRLYLLGGGFSNLFVGQAVGGSGGASVLVGQRVYSASGNACAMVGADFYNTGNGNALFGRQHISRKNRSFLAGTGHDTTNARSESVSALGQWSDLSSTDILFAVGDGTSATDRSNAFEVRDQSFVIKSANGTKWKVTVDNSGNLITTAL